MEILKSRDVKVGLVSYSEGDKVIDTITKGSFSKRGGLIRIEYESAEDMPSGKTTVIISSEDNGKIKITRDGDSPLNISAEKGEGGLTIGYAGCYSISGTVNKVKTKILPPDESVFSVKISYVMNAGGMKNKIEQTMRVFELGER